MILGECLPAFFRLSWFLFYLFLGADRLVWVKELDEIRWPVAFLTSTHAWLICFAWILVRQSTDKKQHRDIIAEQQKTSCPRKCRRDNSPPWSRGRSCASDYSKDGSVEKQGTNTKQNRNRATVSHQTDYEDSEMHCTGDRETSPTQFQGR